LRPGCAVLTLVGDCISYPSTRLTEVSYERNQQLDCQDSKAKLLTAGLVTERLGPTFPFLTIGGLQ